MAKISKGFGELLKQQRRSQGSASTKTSTIKIQNQNSTPPLRNYEEQEKRIGEIVGLDKDGEVNFVNEKTLNSFYEYLVQNLTLPCEVTGSEDFPWEEYYIIGGGSKQEHNKLRKTKPSYLDTYELLKVVYTVEGYSELMVAVKRTSDKKKFTLPLADLEVSNGNSQNARLIDDYAFWYVNWR